MLLPLLCAADVSTAGPKLRLVSPRAACLPPMLLPPVFSLLLLLLFSLLRWRYFLLPLPVVVSYTTRFSDISSLFRQTPDCSDILTFLYRDICVCTLCCLKLNITFFPHWSHQEPKTRDETNQGYLPRPVRDPEQPRASAARVVRRGMHGMGQKTLPARTARHSSINARTDSERYKRKVHFFGILGGIRPL